MSRSHRVIALALMLPLPALAIGASMIADALGRRAARSLDVATRDLLRPPERGAAPIYVEALPAPALPAVAASAEVRAPPSRAARPSRPPSKGIRVQAGAVLRLANSGARPGGVPVPARGDRPAGLALTGVGGLGIGLVDGDVLTHAAGRPALSPGDVIGVVLGSRAAHAPEIWGRFWRNGESWNLVVEQPYPRVRPDPRTGS